MWSSNQFDSSGGGTSRNNGFLEDQLDFQNSVMDDERSHTFNRYDASDVNRFLGNLSAFIQQSEEDGYEMMETDQDYLHKPESYPQSLFPSHLCVLDEGINRDNRFKPCEVSRYALKTPQEVPAYCEPDGYESNDDFFDTLPRMLEESDTNHSSTSVREAPAINMREEVSEITLPNGVNLRRVSDIPQAYQSVFGGIPCFNLIQSKVMDSVMNSNCPVVVAAPTGSGKTVIFELAIVKLLRQIDVEFQGWDDYKIIYMAPVKALCAERLDDWSKKFGTLGLRCAEVTGDMDQNCHTVLRKNHIILTTPEKWDSMTRQWKENQSLVQHIKLILIDEVHLLNENTRGPTLEAVVSRMKTIELSLQLNSTASVGPKGIRFLAVSATIPNIVDIAKWIGYGSVEPFKFFSVGEEHRPVRLKKVVYGYECRIGWSSFRFDLQLTYRLKEILLKHSEGKPSLVFCSTRKSVTQTVSILVGGLTLVLSKEQKTQILSVTSKLVDKKIGETLVRGIGAHHAGMQKSDRTIVENLFRSGSLPVLVSTSTLAMGVNLPAHLVVIKSTEQYVNGAYCEYSESSILQMMGRAGRPQFDTSATAVIMTKQNQKTKYDQLIGGHQLVESSLHLNLAEHLNAEVVLQTINDLSMAMAWLKSTFLFVRALKNPKHYKFSPVNVEAQLKDLCLKVMSALSKSGIVDLDGMDVSPTEVGKIMAKYYISLPTMELFLKGITETATLETLLQVMSRSAEFNEHQLRVAEKRTLNELNKKIRFKVDKKVQSRDSKVFVLVQTVLGCLQNTDISLHQESFKIMKSFKRLSKCLSDFVLCQLPRNYSAVLGAALIVKCAEKSLWPDSEFVARQLDGIGPKYSENLVAAGKTTFQSITESNPRDLERIMGVGTSKGNVFIKTCRQLPEYSLSLTHTIGKLNSLKLEVKCTLANIEELQKGKTAGQKHSALILIADRSSNVIIYSNKILDSYLMKTPFKYSTFYDIPSSMESVDIVAHIMSESWVGIDKETSFVVINAGFQPKPEKDTPDDKPVQTSGAAKKQKTAKETKKSAPKTVKDAPLKKKPSINTQTLDKYRLVKRLPVNRMLKAVPKIDPIKESKIAPIEAMEIDRESRSQTPELIPCPCSPSYSPLYSPSICSVDNFEPIKTKSPPKKLRQILNYPLPKFCFDLEFETESEDEFEMNPFQGAKLSKLPSATSTFSWNEYTPGKRSLSPAKEIENLMDTIVDALGDSVTPKISTLINQQCDARLGCLPGREDNKNYGIVRQPQNTWLTTKPHEGRSFQFNPFLSQY